MKDLFGKAILDYQLGNYTEDIKTETSISEEDDLPLPYLFRSFKDMPKLERKALTLAKGKVLDIGCGAGSHALYLQDTKELEVTAVDISPNAIRACELRGVKDARNLDVMTLDSTEKYDTILLLMNGAGMCGKLEKLGAFLEKLKSILAPGGQILLDSSDIIYMFDDDEDGGVWIPADKSYYGEVDYIVKYKGETEPAFDWMYVDFTTLKKAANYCGLSCTCIMEGEHYDYLAKLTL
ncbi:class I SAM-dependent methyltransferase [Neptunitalea lumnitzerae]|uniref:SAM-dependent methyltransferase n=1 Tax=Neptunitalea lumnitzerae TaxID=2965509 RepID=A0ABQ5MHJ7_9FLAO|nr:methyltransferase domain-containing protein [Neptunitalea sp. Y10]GLB48886.1 SAM-dependent methyltransferase [Neptunitalea sp. Y10]